MGTKAESEARPRRVDFKKRQHHWADTDPFHAGKYFVQHQAHNGKPLKMRWWVTHWPVLMRPLWLSHCIYVAGGL